MKTIKLLFLTLFLAVFSTQAMPKGYSKKEIHQFNISTINKMIKTVQSDIDDKKCKKIALALYQTSRMYGVDPKIMIAIIATESNFNNDVVSSSGDLSLAQINTKVWDLEFTRLGLGKINEKLLKKDEVYALNKMGKILSILKARHAKTDIKWYAIYHSKTKKHKDRYDGKVQSHLRTIASMTL